MQNLKAQGNFLISGGLNVKNLQILQKKIRKTNHGKVIKFGTELKYTKLCQMDDLDFAYLYRTYFYSASIHVTMVIAKDLKISIYQIQVCDF